MPEAINPDVYAECEAATMAALTITVEATDGGLCVTGRAGSEALHFAWSRGDGDDKLGQKFRGLIWGMTQVYGLKSHRQRDIEQ